MKDDFDFDACPDDCYDDCNACVIGYYDCLELAEESEVELEDIETPHKFQHLETMPPKPHYCTLLDEHERKLDRRTGSHRNQGRKPRTTDMRRSPRLAPIMARQLEERLEAEYQERLHIEIEEATKNTTAEAEVIELDFDQACQEHEQYLEEKRMHGLEMLYFDELFFGKLVKAILWPPSSQNCQQAKAI